MNYLRAAHCFGNQWISFRDSFVELRRSTGWPNSKTTCALVLTVANVACEVLKSSFLITFGCNLPVRIFCILCLHEDRCKVVLEAAALVALIAGAIFAALVSPVISFGSVSVGVLTIGRFIVIGLDVGPEFLKAYQILHRTRAAQSQEIPLETLLKRVPDVKSRIGAIQFLGISEQEARDPTIVREHYMIPVLEYKRRLSRNQRHQSIIVRSWVTQLISYYQEAYRTLGGVPRDDDGKPYGDPD